MMDSISRAARQRNGFRVYCRQLIEETKCLLKLSELDINKNDENKIIIQSNRKILEERCMVVKDIDCHILEQLETYAEVEKEIAEAAEFEKAVIEILLNIELFLRKYHYAVSKPKCQFMIVSAFFPPLVDRVAAKMLGGGSTIPPIRWQHISNWEELTLYIRELWRVVGDVRLQNDPKLSNFSVIIVKLRASHISVFFPSIVSSSKMVFIVYE